MKRFVAHSTRSILAWRVLRKGYEQQGRTCVAGRQQLKERTQSFLPSPTLCCLSLPVGVAAEEPENPRRNATFSRRNLKRLDTLFFLLSDTTCVVSCRSLKIQKTFFPFLFLFFSGLDPQNNGASFEGQGWCGPSFAGLGEKRCRGAE